MATQRKVFFVVSVDGSSTDTYAARTLGSACELANIDEGSTMKYTIVVSTDEGAARLDAVRRPRPWNMVR
jgi:transcription elongation GreA/GreB family factor